MYRDPGNLSVCLRDANSGGMGYLNESFPSPYGHGHIFSLPSLVLVAE